MTASNMKGGSRAMATSLLYLLFLGTNGFVHNTTPIVPTIIGRTEINTSQSRQQQQQQQQLGRFSANLYRCRKTRDQLSWRRSSRDYLLQQNSHAASRKVSPPRMMSISAESLTVSVVSGATSSTFVIQASYIEPHTRTRRSWTAIRSEQDFYALGVSVIGSLRGTEEKIPGPPGMGSSPAVFEGYLKRLVDAPLATSLPALYAFLDAPEDLIGQDPVLFGEVIRGDVDPFLGRRGKRFRSADPATPRWSPPPGQQQQRHGAAANGADERDRRAGTAVAGALGGWLVGGPVGAAVGAVAVRAASGRDDGVGELAKGAGAVADAALKKATDLEREHDITRKAGQAVRGATEAVKKVDEGLRVRERARGAATKAVEAAQKADKEFRVRERAGEAAKAAERAARRAAEAARKVEKEHRLQERAGDAFRRLRSRVQRSVEDLERRRQQEKDRH